MYGLLEMERISTFYICLKLNFKLAISNTFVSEKYNLGTTKQTDIFFYIFKVCYKCKGNKHRFQTKF